MSDVLISTVEYGTGGGWTNGMGVPSSACWTRRSGQVSPGRDDGATEPRPRGLVL